MASANEETDNGQATGSQKKVFDFSVSDFAKLVNTATFVDKTLMMKDILSRSSRILITAPPRFGKSINIDMIKRFLEIEVDETGTPKPINATNNYRIFKENNLEIFNDQDFVNKHFGKYPVMHLDCEPLGAVHDYRNMLDAFRIIIQKSFNHHSYLLHEARFRTDATYFLKQLTENTELDLMRSFEYLSNILYRYFGKEVFVLIDNYDAFVNSVLWRNDNSGREKMISFIKITMDNLLKNNRCVGQALLTGVLPVTGVGFPFHRNNIDCYSSLDGQPFCKYYGVTADEVNRILNTVLKDDEEINSTIRVIDELYKGYRTGNQGTEMYSIWSVLQYVHRRIHYSYLSSRTFIEDLKPLLSNSLVKDRIQELLLGNELRLEAPRLLSATNVLHLISAIERGECKTLSSVQVDKFFTLLYHFGYLSICKNFDRQFVSFKIPNEEIKHELGTKVDYSRSYLGNTWSVVDSFGDGSTYLDDSFKMFGNAVIEFLRYSKELLTDLFSSLINRPNYRQTLARRIGPTGKMVILLKNKYQVGFCITAERVNADYRGKDATMKEVKNYADKHLTKITDNSEKEVFDACRDLCGKILIAFAICDKYGSCVAYSYYFKEGDSLKHCNSYCVEY